MKRVLIVLFGLLLLGGCGNPTDDMKVISFNIRYNSWYDRESPNRWELRRDAVVRMICEEQPAALGLQEALIDQLQYLDKLPAAVPPRGRGPRRRHGGRRVHGHLL